jgi:hypothetical protein
MPEHSSIDGAQQLLIRCNLLVLLLSMHLAIHALP